MNTDIFDLGKIGITLGREYDNNVIYEKLTIVLYKGKSYISTKTTQGISPEQDILTWQLVAEAKDAYQMLVDAGKITLTEEEFLEQLVDATKGRYIVQGNVINAADEEDLTVEHSDLLGIDTLKLANRDNTNGMGYVILRKNKSFTEQMTKENTIYIIRYDFTLEKDITIPANCMLKFDGGSISGTYTITGNNTCIEAELVKIFNTDITIDGTWKVAEIYPEWFGAKGDYNVENNSGTDDSASFTKAIAVAQTINCNLIRLSSSIYYIDNSINISDGNIRIVGCYANIREDNKFNFKNNVKELLGSSFVTSPQCSSIITLDSTFTHPAIIQNVGFYNFWEINNNVTAKAINIDCAFYGPTWPVTIEYCHFFGFKYAINVTNRREYNVHLLRVQYNGFFRNDYCVHFDNMTAWNDFSRNYTYGIILVNNCAHHNGCFFYGALAVGTSIIAYNNLEGNISTNNDGSYASNYHIDVEMGNGASLTIENNYEELSKCYLHLNLIDGTVTETRYRENTLIFKNNARLTSDSDYIEISSNHLNFSNNPQQCIIIKECDYNVKCVNGFCGIVLPYSIPNIILVSGAVLIESNNSPIDTFTPLTNSIKHMRAPVDGFTNNIIVEKSLDVYSQYCTEGLCYTSNNDIAIGDANKKFIGSLVQIDRIFNIGSCFGRYTNDAQGDYTTFLDVNSNYKWKLFGRIIENYTVTRDFFWYFNPNVHISFVELFGVTIENGENISLKHNLLSTIKYNEIKSNNVQYIQNPENGDEIYIYDTKKKAIYDGTQWVDATGTPI